MDTIQMQSAWFFILLFVMTVYSVLDSFDLGIGMIIPFVKNNDTKRNLFAAISPFWDGNEVWLIIAGGSLFAIFSQAYATVLSGFYIPVILLMVALIFRAMSLEFWHVSNNSKKLWEWTFATGSFLIVVVLCVALGNVICGIHLNSSFVYNGNPIELFGWLPLVLAITGVMLSLINGILHAYRKIPDFSISPSIFSTLILVSVISILLLCVLLALNRVECMTRPIFWISGLASAAFPFIVSYLKARKMWRPAFVISSCTIALVWLLLASAHYPVLVYDSNPLHGNSITIATSIADPATMRLIFIFAVCGIVAFSILTFIIYKIFRGPVSNWKGYAVEETQEQVDVRQRSSEQYTETKQ